MNPEILEKLLQEAQRESLQSNPPSPLVETSSTKSSLYCEHHHIESSTPILVDLDGGEKNEFLMRGISNLTSPIKLIDTPPNYKDSNKLLYQTKSSSSPIQQCSHCLRHQQQIDILLEKQIDQEKMLINLRKEYEQKLLTKSPEFMLSSQSSISSSISDSESDNNNINDETKATTITKASFQLKQTNSTIRRQNSSTATLIAAAQTNNTIINQPNTSFNSSSNQNLGYPSSIYNYSKKSSTTDQQPDWIKYWSSRPQTQPPK